MQIKVNGIELYAETLGNPSDPPILLIGVTTLSWPSGLCTALTGRYVVRYDLRDTGQSTFTDPGAPVYDLRDLVTDASELVAALNLGRTHVAGMGVGGFIAQLLALDHPDQVASLTLVSTRPVAPGPADPDLPAHAPEVMEQLFGRPAPDWTHRESVVGYMTGSARLLSGSKGFNEQDVRATAGAIFDRAEPTAEAQRASHLGTAFAAMDCQPRWRERLGEITASALVIHGDEDPFFPHHNGVVLAAEIPDATLLTLPGIGQGLPRVTWPAVAGALLRHTSGHPLIDPAARPPLPGCGTGRRPDQGVRVPARLGPGPRRLVPGLRPRRAAARRCPGRNHMISRRTLLATGAGTAPVARCQPASRRCAATRTHHQTTMPAGGARTRTEGTRSGAACRSRP
ncbi:alpha/beta fold hydrolase [Longispora albida]|uniref:alpha/beta fold hydrolase n=1 Tax=Longispora albida TaxID=203523 RepID=UPI00037EFA9F|nr:alpha/beta hydrolase [Longispora albida]